MRYDSLKRRRVAAEVYIPITRMRSAHLRTPLTSETSVLGRISILITTITSARTSSKPISAYSTAVAPDSFDMNINKRVRTCHSFRNS